MEHLLDGIARVDIAVSRKAADRMLHQHRYALVLLDLALPDQPGTSLLDDMASDRTPVAPVIVYSVIDHPTDRTWPFLLGAFTKSKVAGEDLKRRIVDALAACAGPERQ